MVMPTPDYKPPTSAEVVVGKVVLLGLTWFDGDGKLVRQLQRHGVIRRVSAEEGVVLWCEHDHHEMRLPADLDALQQAPSGTFREASTDEAVTDPDLIAMWELHQCAGSPESWEWRRGPALRFPKT